MRPVRRPLLLFALVLLTLALSASARQTAPEEAPVANPQLRDELLAMREEDQKARKEWIANQSDAALQKKVKEIDERNTKRVTEIIEQHGWPGKSLVGMDASAAAWIVIQHATPEVIDKYLPLLKEAAAKGEVSMALVALTIDRQLVYHGKPQIYGSQFKAENGQWVPQTLEDPANVDKRRAEVGLGPLETYARDLREMYGPPPPKQTETPKETEAPKAEEGGKPPHA